MVQSSSLRATSGTSTSLAQIDSPNVASSSGFSTGLTPCNGMSSRSNHESSAHRHHLNMNDRAPVPSSSPSPAHAHQP